MRYVVAVVVLVIVAAAVVAGIQWTRPLPAPSFSAHVVSSVTLPGKQAKFPWPSLGSAALAVEGLGEVAKYGSDTPQPIASIAKVMTAEIILTDHPLAPGANGPSITFDAADVAVYNADVAQSESVVPVVAGESLTELQCLEALLIPSANNIAEKLAGWDASSTSAFVAKMNATAVRLGMHSTTFTDPSGFEQTTVSTASDLVLLGEATMRNPVLASVVSMPQVTLPHDGTVYNYDYDLGRDGIVGIKTGSDTAAGGCFLFQSDEHVGTKSITIVGAVLGQETVSPITAALNEAKSLVAPVVRDLHEMQALPQGLVVGHISTAWDSSTTATTTTALEVFGWPGEKFTVTFNPIAKLPAKIVAGTQVGTVVLDAYGKQEVAPVTTTGGITGPTDSWRLKR